MVNSEILEYLSSGLRRGFKLEVIKQQLLSRGYFDYDINEAIEEIFPKKERIARENKKYETENTIRGWNEKKN